MTAKPDNTVRDARILRLHTQRQTPWQIVDRLIADGLLPSAATEQERKERWNLVRSAIRRFKKQRTLPGDGAAAESIPETNPTEEPTAKGTPDPAVAIQETITPASFSTVTIGHRTFTILFPQLLRPLSERERQDLKDSIRAYQGIQVPVVIDESNGVIDGGNRLILAAELGLPLASIPFQIKHGLTEAEKVTLALTLNADRCHLTPEQRKELIAQRKQRVVEARSHGDTIRAIAVREGIDTKQVQRDLESAGVDMSTPQPETVKGRDGKRYPAKKKTVRRVVMSTPEPETEESAVETEVDQQQAELPFAEGGTRVTPTPYPQAQGKMNGEEKVEEDVDTGNSFDLRLEADAIEGWLKERRQTWPEIERCRFGDLVSRCLDSLEACDANGCQTG